MSTFNRAYSAPHGYDLRTPYNVPMGEIQKLRVVRPFSIESYKPNTLVQGFGHSNKKVYYNFPPNNLSHHSKYIQAVQDPCSRKICFDLVENERPWYNDIQVERLYMKGYPRVK